MTGKDDNMEDELDAETLAAFLDDDSDVDDRKESGKEDDEMDAETLAAFLDENSNDSEVPSTAADKAAVSGSDELDPDTIAAFLGESDSDDDIAETTTDNKATSVSMAEHNTTVKTTILNTQEKQANVAAVDLNSQALQAELAAMQKRMLELQQLLSPPQQLASQPQQLLSQPQQLVSQPQQLLSQPQQLPSPSQRNCTQAAPGIVLESDGVNPFFPCESQKIRREKKISGSSSKTSLSQSQKSSATSGQRIAAKKPSAVEQADRCAMKHDLFGDSDSDLEDMDGEKTSLSVQGAQIKGLLSSGQKNRQAHSQKYPPPVCPTERRPSTSWNSKTMVTRDSLGRSSSSQSNSVQKSAGHSEEKYIVDSFSGIRIVKPLVSSWEMDRKMKERKVIRCSRIQAKVNTADLQGDWVTIGVVVQKTEPKQSSSGKTYCIWKISDLDNSDTSVSFFLFGQTYKEHWKNDVGTVVGVLNPSIMDSADKGSKGVAFTINNPKQLLLMGQSKDLGFCTSRTKKGNICHQFINKKFGDFCSYHVQSAYKKTSATRGELQGSVTGLTPKSFQKTLLPKKGSFFIHGGQTYTDLPHVKSSMSSKNQVTIKKLQIEQQLTKSKVTTMSVNEIKSCGIPAMKKASVAEKDQAFMDMLSTPTVGSLNLVKHLVKKETKGSEKKDDSIFKFVSAKGLIKEHKLMLKEKRRSRSSLTGGPSPAVNPINVTPSLGTGLHSGEDLFMDFPTSRKLFSPSVPIDVAKKKAVDKIRAKGGIVKQDPNAVRNTSPNPEKTRKRVLEDAEENSTETSAHPAKRSRLLGNVDVNSPEFQRMLKAKSKHKGALAEAEAEQEERYFDQLEKKEKMEEKMLSITKLEVSVVTCRQCKYTAFSAKDTCKTERHELVRHKCMKRFFKCKKCKHRTTSLDKYPTVSCSSCGSSSYERTSMAVEKSGPKLDSETLCLRGDEEKFLGSLQSQSFKGTL